MCEVTGNKAAFYKSSYLVNAKRYHLFDKICELEETRKLSL